MVDPALQAGQRLLHSLFIRWGMMQGIIDIADRIIEQGEDVRRGQFFPMRAESGNVAGEGMIETQQAKGGLALGGIRPWFRRQVRDDGSQFSVAVVGVTACDTVGQPVVAALVVLLQDGIQITAVRV